MKASYTASGVVLLALAGLWYAGGGSAAPARTAAAAEQPHVSAPLTHNNLTVYFVHGPDAVGDTHKVATLQEALEAGWAVVHETGNVNTLTVENNSADCELFIQEGDIIKGGQQDRVFAIDMLVPPRSGVVPFPAHCVEHNRWTKRGSESATQFSKSDQRIVGTKLQYANATGQQGEVWDNVKKNQEKFNENLKTKVTAAESESSFQLTLENRVLQARVAEFEAALRAAGEGRKNVVGVVFLVNGQITGAEVYGSNALFLKAWPKLLKSQAADAVAERTDKALPPVPSTQEVERFLAVAGRQTAPATSARPGSRQQIELELVNVDPALQTNLEAALPEVNGVLPLQLAGRSGATRNRLLNTGGGQAQAAQVQTLGVVARTNDPVPNQQGALNQQVAQAIDNLPGVPNTAVPFNANGNRLNVQRVEDRAGLVSESRDPTRQNAVFHKSYIKK